MSVSGSARKFLNRVWSASRQGRTRRLALARRRPRPQRVRRPGRVAPKDGPEPSPRRSFGAWRELPLSVISLLRTQLAKEELRAVAGRAGERRALIAGARRRLDQAEEACLRASRFKPRSGTLERAWVNIRMVEAELLLLVSEDEVRARTPHVLAMVRRHISAHSPQRKAVEKAAAEIGANGRVTDFERSTLARGLAIANAALGGNYRRVRVLASRILIATGAASVGVALLAVWGFADKESVDLCFRPQPPGNRVVCPTGEHPAPREIMPPPPQPQAAPNVITSVFSDRLDVLTVECAGLVGAALTVVTAIGRLHENHSSPYEFRLPLATALLKFPLGALSALAGILLIKAAFVPGLSNLDSSAQILGWSVLFGAAQHLVTHLVDQRAEETLSGVRKPP